ncbi:MAG: gliding motility-associated C-terminal domain-containing protein [Bacteroidetes bacterium]|nr:gliding motility-associated C-terminal domain-containing protein [Bacteroidota bacterium]
MKITSGLILAVSLFFTFLIPVRASHNRAGYINIRHLYGLTYEVTITTWTDGCSACSDRPKLTISYETCTDTSDDEEIYRINGPDTSPVDGIPDGEILSGFEPETIKVNIYRAIHSWPGPGPYRVSLTDPNRNKDVVNMSNSFETPFYIETLFYIQGGTIFNSSPVITIPPVYNACLGEIFIYNPGAIDTVVEADSLSYQIHVCFQNCDSIVPGFITPGTILVDPITGSFIWNKPTSAGRYNFAMDIYEWRDGVIISITHLDMQIFVQPCDNEPPEIADAGPFCVLAGDTLAFTVTVVDPDADSLILTATGDPFTVNPYPASFDTATGDSVVSSLFSWAVSCNHVRKSPYSVYFKAEDDDYYKLVDIQTVQITVIAPPPQNLNAAPLGNSIQLTWSQSICPQVTGYNVYRGIAADTGSAVCPCETGLTSSSGYELIGTTEGWNITSFTDNDNGNGLIHGIRYCYRVTVLFPDGSESCPSPPACANLKKDLPIITHVDVVSTDNISGIIDIKWSVPVELDTIQVPGPYRYLIYRSPDMNGTALALIDSVEGMYDTTYTDTALNTTGIQYSYRIDFYTLYNNNRNRLGFTQKASSVYLQLIPNDNVLMLTWDEKTPWVNYLYEVYKFNPATSQFDSIGSTENRYYSDTGLVNGREYCYYIRSIGTYGTTGIIDPIFNRSQRNCGIPRDFIPPCPPVLNVTPDCNNATVTFLWNNPNYTCSDDVVSYKVYMTPVPGDLYNVIGTITVSSDTFFTYFNPSSIAGCYAVVALDTFNNESPFSNVSCIDNCPVYTLPNVFTPDGNNINDRFTPFPYKYIEKVDVIIFNRWGQVVFETTDPDILWDGKHQSTGKDCTTGVYYYLCKVTEKRLYGPQEHVLTGYIELLRDSSPQMAK